MLMEWSLKAQKVSFFKDVNNHKQVKRVWEQSPCGHGVSGGACLGDLAGPVARISAAGGLAFDGTAGEPACEDRGLAEAPWGRCFQARVSCPWPWDGPGAIIAHRLWVLPGAQVWAQVNARARLSGPPLGLPTARALFAVGGSHVLRGSPCQRRPTSLFHSGRAAQGRSHQPLGATERGNQG